MQCNCIIVVAKIAIKHNLWLAYQRCVSVIEEGGRGGSCQCCSGNRDDWEYDAHGVTVWKEDNLFGNADCKLDQSHWS